MNRQSQQLFENPYANREYYTHPELETEWELQTGSHYPTLGEEEWETMEIASRQQTPNLRSRVTPQSRNHAIIRTASISPKIAQSQKPSIVAQSSGQPTVLLTGFTPAPPPSGTTLLTRFAFGKSELSTAHIQIIRQIVKKAIALMPRMTPLSILVIDVEGHEDEVGDPTHFGNLGLQRAQAVTKVLTAELAKAVKNVVRANLRNVEIKISSAGPTRPIRSNVTAEGRALNRRVEVRMKEDTSRVA